MTQPSSRLNPHRSLVALDGEGSTSTGVASLRGRNGESLHVRVVQSQEREDLNMHRVRWVFTEGSETFQVELLHPPVCAHLPPSFSTHSCPRFFQRHGSRL